MDIVFNIIGGIVVAVLIEVWIRVRKSFKGKKFRHIFGFNFKDPFYLTYGIFELGPYKILDINGKEVKFPFLKREIPEKIGNLTSLVSDSHNRSLNYIVESFGRYSRMKPSLIADTKLTDKHDISYCSIGGRNNLKTKEIEQSRENKFFKFNLKENAIVGIKDSNLKFVNDGHYDYGFIIKIIPESLPNRSWIAIAGLGEWGTSGAAWFLARNWRIIEKKFGKNPFGLVIKVKGQSDELAQLVYPSFNTKKRVAYKMKAGTGYFRVRLNLLQMFHKRPGVKKFLKKVYSGHKNSGDKAKHPDGLP